MDLLYSPNPKSFYLAWIFLHNSIPTQVVKSSYQDKGSLLLIVVGVCDTCLSGCETTEKLLVSAVVKLLRSSVECPCAKLTWNGRLIALRFMAPFFLMLQLYALFSIKNEDAASKYSYLRRIACILCIHLIWDTRNTATFYNKWPTLSQSIGKHDYFLI